MGLDIERDLGQGITQKRRNGPKRIDIERDMVLQRRKKQVNPISQMGLSVKLIILPKNQEGMVSISQQKVLVMDKMGMGEMRVEMIKRNLEVLNNDFEDKGEEESDTEDSYELEIPPRQLNQVTPGGRVLKIKLS